MRSSTVSTSSLNAAEGRRPLVAETQPTFPAGQRTGRASGRRGRGCRSRSRRADRARTPPRGSGRSVSTKLATVAPERRVDGIDRVYRPGPDRRPATARTIRRMPIAAGASSPSPSRAGSSAWSRSRLAHVPRLAEVALDPAIWRWTIARPHPRRPPGLGGDGAAGARGRHGDAVRDARGGDRPADRQQPLHERSSSSIAGSRSAGPGSRRRGSGPARTARRSC